MRLDDEGHLAYGEDGRPLPGLCHCVANEAHAADPAIASGGPAQITDPADRLNDEFVKALEKRYCNMGEHDTLEAPDFTDRYAKVCDLVVQLLWPEKYGTWPADPAGHTSGPARAIARLFFIAAEITPDSR
jgi:hypothetical protein